MNRRSLVRTTLVLLTSVSLFVAAIVASPTPAAAHRKSQPQQATTPSGGRSHPPRPYAQVTGPPDDQGNWAYCSIDSMVHPPSHISGDDDPTPAFWLSCEYGPTDRSMLSIRFTVWSTDYAAPGGGPWGGVKEYGWNTDTCAVPGVTCQINSGGLFQMAVSGVGTRVPTTAWNDFRVSSCSITFDSPTDYRPCSIYLFSKASTGFPAFPDKWFPGGVDGNTTPIGQTFGGGPSDDGIDPTDWVAEPVNTLTGSFYTGMVDASLPGFGLPFAFQRSYNSADSTLGPMGYGWTFKYNAYLDIKLGGDLTYHTGRGQQLFYAANADGTTFNRNPGVLSALVKNGDGTYSLTRRNGTILTFKAPGTLPTTTQLKSITDRNGNQVSLVYAGGNLSTIADSTGRVISFTFNNSNRLTQMSLPDGRSVSYTYSSSNLTTVTDLIGNIWTYGYDTNGNHRLKTITDPRGTITVSNVYSAAGRVTQQTDGEGNVSTFSWDDPTQTLTFTDARGKVWEDVYSRNKLIQRIDPLGNSTTYTYDGSLQPLTITTPNNNNSNITWSFTYDDNGNQLTSTDPLGNTTTTTYNNLKEPLTVASPLEQGTSKHTDFAYDAKGNLTSVTQPVSLTQSGQVVTQYAPDAVTGQLDTVTDPNGKALTYHYGAKGNLTKVTDALNNSTNFAYDTSGRLITKTDARTNVWSYTYNNANELLTASDPVNPTHPITYTYTKIGETKTVTDPRGNVTTYAYDGNGRLQTVKAPDNTVVATYTYWSTGQLHTAQDANGDVTTYALDNAGRVSSVTDAKSNVWQFEYWPDGHLKKKTLPSGDTATYNYFKNGQLQNVTYSNSNTPNVSFTYDTNGEELTMTDGAGTLTYGYDLVGRLTSATRGSDAFGYTYNGGQLQQRTYPDATVIGYGYNDDEQVNSITADGQTTSYGYDPNGNLSTTTLGNGLTTNYTWDAANRLTNLANKQGSTVISNYAMTLDRNGNPTQVVGPSGTTNYTYDTMNRVLTACQPTCTGTNNGVAYTYDYVGNRTTQTSYGSTSSTTTYRYNADNQLCWAYVGTSSNACTSPPGGATTYGYDVNGNQTSAGSRTFTYDSQSRLLSSTLSGTTEAYAYDGVGNMLTRSVGGTSQNQYVWDPSTSLPTLAIERDGSGGALRRYVYGAGGPGGLLSERNGGSSYYYLPDGFGSTANLTSATGSLEWSYGFDPYGKNTTATQNDPNAPANPMQFEGQYADPTSTLYNLRARQYDAGTGRFLGTDPANVTAGGRIVSSYAYAFDQPTMFSDPSGMAAGTGGGLFGWICAGSCGDLFYEIVHHPVASWRMGPMLPKMIGFALIAISMIVLAPEILGAAAEGSGEVGADAAIEEEAMATSEEAASGTGSETAVSCANSFVAGTKVAMTDDRQVPIQRIGLRDRVASASPDTRTNPRGRRVVALVHHRDGDLYQLRVGGERIEATALHPFFVPHRGWTEVRDLRTGVRLATAGGGSVRLTSIRRLYAAKTMVYNLDVRGVHTFFVGRDRLLVHNCAAQVEIRAGSLSTDQALSAGEQYVGEGYSEIDNGVFRSADQLRQFRINTGDWVESGPHVHFETVGEGGEGQPMNWRFDILDP
jgi:RHS repeat-associated protein